MNGCHCNRRQYTTDSTHAAFFETQVQCDIAFKPVGVFYTVIQLFHTTILNVNNRGLVSRRTRDVTVVLINDSKLGAAGGCTQWQSLNRQMESLKGRFLRPDHFPLPFRSGYFLFQCKSCCLYSPFYIAFTTIGDQYSSRI